MLKRQTELAATHLSMLGSITTLGPATPSAIAAHERVRPHSVIRTLSCLADDGLGSHDPHSDGRQQVLISLSDESEDVLAEERARRVGWLAHRLVEMTADERSVLSQAAYPLEGLASA